MLLLFREASQNLSLFRQLFFHSFQGGDQRKNAEEPMYSFGNFSLHWEPKKAPELLELAPLDQALYLHISTFLYNFSSNSLNKRNFLHEIVQILTSLWILSWLTITTSLLTLHCKYLLGIYGVPIGFSCNIYEKGL